MTSAIPNTKAGIERYNRSILAFSFQIINQKIKLCVKKD